MFINIYGTVQCILIFIGGLIDYCLTSSEQYFKYSGLWLWCLTPLSTTFRLHAYRGGQIMMVEETGVHGENHRPVASHW